MEDKTGINIGNVGGDVIGVDVSGSGNTVGKDINIEISGIVAINSRILNKLPEGYSTAFREFTEKLNQQLRKRNLTLQQVRAIEESINELIKETEGLSPVEAPSNPKKQRWKEKFLEVLENTLPVLPKTVETIAAFTPLAPFSNILGETLERVIESYNK